MTIGPPADGVPHFDYNAFHDHCLLAAEMPLSPGRHTLVVSVIRGPERDGELTLRVDGDVKATGRIPRVIGLLSSTGMDIGRAIAPINRSYTPPFAYPGRISRVVFELPRRATEKDRTEEAEREARKEMSRQ